MATEMLEVEVWVKVNESGEYDVGHDEDTANDRFRENVDSVTACRLVRMVVKVPKPRPLTVKVELPDDQSADDLAATVTAN